MSLICPICQENLVNSDSVDNYVNKCGHVYHSACLLPWWDTAPSPTCPECRQPCNMDTITKIFFSVEPTDNVKNDVAGTSNGDGDIKTIAITRQIKEYIDVTTYNQTKDLNDKFRHLQSEFSSLLLNGNQRLATNCSEKLKDTSKELTEVISGERKRLLIELSEERKPQASINNISSGSSCVVDPTSSGKSFRYTALEYCRSRKQREIIPAVIALLCLIAVIVYSQLILNAVKSTEVSGDYKTMNVSNGIMSLGLSLDKVGQDLAKDNDIINNRINELANTVKNGNTLKEYADRMSSLSTKIDKILLEQVEGNRKGDLKLELLQNDVKYLQSQLNVETAYVRQTFEKDLANVKQMAGSNEQLNLRLKELEDTVVQSNLEKQKILERNVGLNLKLTHLQEEIANNDNIDAAGLRNEIEQDERGLVTQAKATSVWDDIMSKIGVASGSAGITSYLPNIALFFIVVIYLQNQLI